MATSRDWDGPQRCYRTSKLLVEGGGYFVRELVKQKVIHPTGTFNTLDIFLANKKPTIGRLKQRRIINNSQYDILYPQNTIPTNIDHWDITLASCIVTQCCTLSQTEERAVDDIRKLRNTLHGHVTTVSMSEQEFQKQWADVSKALTNAALLLTSSARQTHISEMIRIIFTEILSPGETIDALKTWFTQANAVETKLDEIADRQASLDTSVRETSDKCDEIKFTLSDIEKYMKDKEAKLKKEQVDQRELNREIEAAKIKLGEHTEARGGNVDCLANLAEHVEDINIKTNKGYTPLHEAAYCGKIKVVIYLCDTFPEMIRMNDNNNQSSAQHAAAGGHLDCLTYLIEKGINPWIKSNRGFTLLHEASHCGKLGVVKHLCKTYPDMIQKKNGYGGNSAFSAVKGGHTDCLKYLIEQGIVALECSTKGVSLLHTACYFGRTEVVKYLCKTYSQLLQMTDRKGETVANHAARGGFVDCLSFVIDLGVNPRLTCNGGVTVLHTACHFGKTDVVKYLCKTHTHLLAMADDTGRTAAHYAAKGGHVDCLDIVIKNGVDPRSKCKDGTTILHAASSFGHLNEIKYIHKHCMIPVDDRDVYSQTATYVASKGGHLDCLGYLLQEKANHAIKTNTGYTLLHVAGFRGRVNVVRFLCTQYKDIVGIKSKSGETAAHMSAKDGHLECLKILFEHGLNPCDMDSRDMTVLDIAAKNGEVETVKYLCKQHPVLLQKHRLRAINLAKQNCPQRRAELIENILIQE